jgi:thioredoxin 1
MLIFHFDLNVFCSQAIIMKDLKSLPPAELGFGEEITVELKVFTLPTCPTCPTAKVVASETARELGIGFREISLATEEGVKQGLAYDIMSTPSIVLDDDVIVRGRFIPREKLEEEVKKRIEKWKERVAKGQAPDT